MTSAVIAASFSETRELCDVGWFSGASVFGFALEPRQPIGVCANASGNTLIATCARDWYRSPGTPRPSRLADQDGDLVRTDSRAGLERHLRGIYSARLRWQSQLPNTLDFEQFRPQSSSSRSSECPREELSPGRCLREPT